ncbi:MAG: hypothetical protein GY814_15130 [Gammaproteobacteria bacterium]|nr:hypothetical protein [Gammaproteobacteria bacterium]
MLKISVTSIFVLLILLLIGSHTHANEEFPAPPRSAVGSVTSSTTTFGMELSIRKFESFSSIEEIMEFYQDLWGDGAYAESNLSPWKMISSRQDDQLLNMQVQYGGSRDTWGYLSISDLPGKLDSGKYQFRKGDGFPKMAGSEVINDQLNQDLGKTGRTILLYNDFSPSSNAAFYKNHYKNKGWETVMNEATATRDDGYALHFRHGSDTVTVTVNEFNGKTSVVANKITRGLLSR